MNIFPGQSLPQFYDSFNRRFAIDNPFILVTFNNDHGCLLCYFPVFRGNGHP